jgi:hypothetical protein
LVLRGLIIRRPVVRVHQRWSLRFFDPFLLVDGLRFRGLMIRRSMVRVHPAPPGLPVPNQDVCPVLVASQPAFSIWAIANATTNPRVVACPATRPPCSKPSGIMVSASMVRTAPAANARTEAGHEPVRGSSEQRIAGQRRDPTDGRDQRPHGHDLAAANAGRGQPARPRHCQRSCPLVSSGHDDATMNSRR